MNIKNLSKKLFICNILLVFVFLIVSCTTTQKQYTINYNLNGGSFSETVQTQFDENNLPNLPTPKKIDHDFVGWMYNDQIITDLKTILGDDLNIKLDAKWAKMKPYLAKDYIHLGDGAILYVPGHFDDSLLNISISSDVISIDKWFNITTLKLGVATITINDLEDPEYVHQLTIEVINKAPIIKSTTNQINVGGKIYFNIDNFDELSENSLADFTWSIDNEKIAVVNDDYSITALNIGEFTLTGTSKKDARISSSVSLKVVDENESIVLSSKEDKYIYKQGEIFNLYPLGDCANKELVWSSSNNEVLRVIDNNTIIGVQPGKATINVYEKGNSKNSTFIEFTITENNKDVDYIGNLLTKAFNEVGYKEGPGNDQKYGIWYNNNKEPWCAMFVSWCWFHVGLSNEILLKYQGCYTGQEWCIKQGIFHYKENYTPKPGDIIFFTSAGMGHTGICAYVDGTYMYTIEGNSSDKVGIWRWSLNDARITGYASPDYPEYDGVVKDFSFLAGKDENGKYYWTNVSEKQDVE